MRFTLKDAADYIVNSNAPAAFFKFLKVVSSIFTFTEERSNRLKRYVKITRAYRNGQSVQAIVDEFGCSNNTVLRYARMAELPKRPKHFPVDIRKAVIADYANKELSVAEIAKLHNVSPAYVSKVAREEGISRYARRPKRKQ